MFLQAEIHTNLASYIGEWSGGYSQRCGIICDIFSRCGVPSVQEPKIVKKIWMKAIYNCVVSPLSTLTNLSHREVYCRKDALYVADKIISETLLVARAEGLDVTEEEGRECLDKVIKSNQDNKSSMAYDIIAKRKSEIDFINGRIVVLAERHNIDVPFNRSMAFFINGLESNFL